VAVDGHVMAVVSSHGIVVVVLEDVVVGMGLRLVVQGVQRVLGG
jgi:hypothetical protein